MMRFNLGFQAAPGCLGAEAGVVGCGAVIAQARVVIVEVGTG